MRHRKVYVIIVCLFIISAFQAAAQTGKKRADIHRPIYPAADFVDAYLPLLDGKRVALLINQTSRAGEQLLLDTLLKRKVHIVKVFVPEHGFRGTADAGAHIGDETDPKTGLPVISLYGNNKKPKKTQLDDVDVVVYDLQDVGARFYTYISTLQYLMQACAENGKQLIILDRPNPNGHYVDGPVLDTSLRSFVGMQSIPVVYGMTAGEYAKMLVGEHWVPGLEQLDMKVVPCINYDHTKKYFLPVPPSPNLRSMEAVYLYPSLCLFEGTAISVGRGTDKPFQQWGHPDFKGRSDYSFTPRKGPGAAKPPYEGLACYGVCVASHPDKAYAIIRGRLNLGWLIQAYQWYPQKDSFFNNFFEKLAGTAELHRQIQNGMSEEQIRASWQKDIGAFKKIRKKYLLYKDFE